MTDIGRLGPQRGDLAGHASLRGLLASEWTKLRSVRSTIWTLGALAVVGVGIGAIATAETRAHWSTMAPGTRLGFDPTQTSLIGVFFAQLVIGILGALAISAEYGTGTIRATLAAAPRRLRVLLAKVVVFGAVALAVSELVAFASYFLGQALLSAPATHTSITDGSALRAVVGAGLFLCLLGLLALGLATIIRHTAGAITAYVGLLLVAPLLVQALPSSTSDDLRRFLPANIGSSVISVTPGIHQFGPWAGLLVLALYAAAVLLLGGLLLIRRDA